MNALNGSTLPQTNRMYIPMYFLYTHVHLHCHVTYCIDYVPNEKEGVEELLQRIAVH